MGQPWTFANLRPSIKHGILAGTVILLVKLVFVITGNWSYRFAPFYPLLSFLPIYAAMIIAGRTERMMFESSFKYWAALKSAMVTIFMVVFISSFAEYIIYNLNQNIKEFSVTLMRNQMIESFKIAGGFYTMKEKDDMIRNINPGSLLHAVSQMFGYFFSNGILALIIALFTRYKAPKNDWLNQDS